jgi:hypothetical protein
LRCSAKLWCKRRDRRFGRYMLLVRPRHHEQPTTREGPFEPAVAVERAHQRHSCGLEREDQRRTTDAGQLAFEELTAVAKLVGHDLVSSRCRALDDIGEPDTGRNSRVVLASDNAHARAPKQATPTGLPSRSHRPWAASTRSMRAPSSSSSVIHATSAPLANAQPIPHRQLATTRSGKSVTNAAMAMPDPLATCATTSASRRLTVSASTPAGSSATTTDAPWNVPMSTSWNGERSATTTR